MTTQTHPMFTQKLMAERKHLFNEALQTLEVQGFIFVGVTKKGIVFEEANTGAMVELTAVAKKQNYNFAEEEAEYLDAVEARVEKERAKAEKLAKIEAKKAEKA